MSRTQELLTTLTATAVAVLTWRYHARHWDSLPSLLLPWIVAGALAVFLCRPGAHLPRDVARPVARAGRAIGTRLVRVRARTWLRLVAVVAAGAVAATAVAWYVQTRRERQAKALLLFYGPEHRAYSDADATIYDAVVRGQIATWQARETGELPPGIDDRVSAWAKGDGPCPAALPDRAEGSSAEPPETTDAVSAAIRDAERRAGRPRPIAATIAAIQAEERDRGRDAIETAIVWYCNASEERRGAAQRWYRVQQLVKRTGLPEDVVAAHTEEIDRASLTRGWDPAAYLLSLPRATAPR